MMRILSTLLAISALLLNFNTAEASTALIMHNEGRSGAVWRKFGSYQKFKENGITANECNTLDWFMGKVSEKDIFNTLSQYHVVLPDIFRGHLDLNYAELTANYRQALEKYVQNGGGLVIIASSPGYTTDRKDAIFNLLFADFGVKMTKEGICDLQNEYQYPSHPFLSHMVPSAPSYLRFFRTANIVVSPITKGVKNLFFPQWGDCGMWGSMLLEYTPEWKIVVRGEKTAMSYLPNTLDSKHKLFTTPGSVKSNPPLAAWREYGKGCIFVLAANDMHVLENCFAFDWPGVFENAGDGKTPSDGHKLLFNAVKLLADNAAQNPELGKYVETAMETEFSQPPEAAPATQSIAALPQGEWRGIIGARSRLSGGSGSIAEYAKEAKNNGFHFIVFTEFFEKMNAEKLQQLKKECTEASDDDFYACPGLEFPDGNGLRWVIWGDRIIFPTDDMLSEDKKRVHWSGNFIELCGRAPNALLDYAGLRKIADPANMWWHNRVPVVVRRSGETMVSTLQDYDFSLADLRGIGVFAFNGITAPDMIAREPVCNMVPGDGKDARTWLNSMNIFNCTLGYVSSGPKITTWGGVNAFNQFLHDTTSGTQRIHLRVGAESPIGIKEIAVYAAPGRLLRRFFAAGEKNHTVDFDLLHDRRMDLYAVVTDTRGCQAVSMPLTATMFFYDIGRCADNLNLLSYATLCSHPDRHDYPTQREYEAKADINAATLVGIDTSAEDDGSFSPYASLNVAVHAAEGDQYWGDIKRDNYSSKPMRFHFTGSGISRVSVDSRFRVDTHNRHRPEQRISFSSASVFPNTDPQPLSDVKLDSYLLRSRIIPCISQTSYWLAAGDYQGGTMLHRVELTAKRDMTLKGDVPIELLFAFVLAPAHFTPARGYWNRILADTNQGLVDAKPANSSGILKDGGYLVICSSQSPRKIMLTAGGSELPICFKAGEGGGIRLGLGTDGMQIKTGQKISINLAVLTLDVPWSEPEKFKAIAAIYQLDKSAGFHTVSAVDNEAPIECAAEPEAICDTPFAVSGVEDNGSASYYELDGTRRYVPAPVEDQTLYFQSDTRKGRKLWAGNLFVADNPEIRITPVLYGLSTQEKPFIEIHNPTQAEVKCLVKAPANAPEYGGHSFIVTIPAGSSIKQVLK